MAAIIAAAMRHADFPGHSGAREGTCDTADHRADRPGHRAASHCANASAANALAGCRACRQRKRDTCGKHQLKSCFCHFLIPLVRECLTIQRKTAKRIALGGDAT